MPKRKIRATIENREEKVITETTAIYRDNIIKYKEEDNTTVVYNYKKHKLVRENKELRIEYIFSDAKEMTGLLFIKELNKTININIKTRKILSYYNGVEPDFNFYYINYNDNSSKSSKKIKKGDENGDNKEGSKNSNKNNGIIMYDDIKNKIAN